MVNNKKKRGTDKYNGLDKLLYNSYHFWKNISYLDNLFSLNFIQESFIPGINREQLRLAHNRVFQF